MLKHICALLVGCIVCMSIFLFIAKTVEASVIIDGSPITTSGTLIDFEGFDNLANADELFLSYGVRFAADYTDMNTVIRHDPNPDFSAYSGIASLRNPYRSNRHTDMNMIFQGSGRQNVEFYFGDTSPIADYVVTALGSSDETLDSITLTRTYLNNNSGIAFLTFLRPSADIWKITIDSLTEPPSGYSYLPTDFYGIDDLRLDGVLQSASPIPEPATMILFGIGLLGLAGISRRKE